MRLIVNPHKIEIIKDEAVNEREIDISKCVFEFNEAITNDYVKEAYFTYKNNTYKQIIINNECSFPSEVLQSKGQVEIGVVAYLVQNEQEIKRYNPSPVFFNTLDGSLKDAENSEPITPSDKEQITQLLQNMETKIDNIDINAEKTEHITTITITKKDGSTESVQVLDGEKGDKGEKGDPGSISFIIVQTLPTENIDQSAIYLVPLTTPESQENNYAEYIYVNNTWELLGKIGVHVDLSGYQEKIDSSHKLSSDLVDDTNNTNKFVTNTEKNTWNGKANASDVYNKTDSDNRYLQNSKIVILTQAEYDALLSKDATVYYLIKEV